MSRFTNFRDIDDIRKAWKRDAAEHYDLSDAWSHVTYNAKKDGSPFALMSKNFEGCTYESHYGKNVLSVSMYGQHGYVSDYINADGKSFEQLRTEIAERANFLSLRGDQITHNLNRLETAYADFSTAYQTALTELRETIGDGHAARAIAETVADECNWKM